MKPRRSTKDDGKARCRNCEVWKARGMEGSRYGKLEVWKARGMRKVPAVSQGLSENGCEI